MSTRSRGIAAVALATGLAAVSACTPAEQSAVCRTYVACRDALNAASHVSEPGLDRYRAGGSCWRTGSSAATCDTYCIDTLAEIRRTAEPLPLECNAAQPGPATPYDPLPPEGACTAPRHLEATTSGIVATRALDVDADGDADVLVLGSDLVFQLLRNDGTGRFSATGLTTTAGASGLTLHDVNGDGRLDAVVFNGSTGYIGVYGARANGTFGALAPGVAVAGSAAALGDFDGDGRADAFVASSGVGGRAFFLPGDGQGGFGAPRMITPGFTVDAPVAFDADEDGDLDVLVASGDVTGLVLGRNDGHAVFTWAPLTGTTLRVAHHVALGDFDGDGHLDVAAQGVDHIAGDAPTVTTVLFGDGAGSFGGEIVRGEPLRTRGFSALDFDGDGRLDLIGAGVGGYDVLPNLGNRMFGPPVAHSAPIAVRDLVFADLDGDGRRDLLLAGLADSTRRESLEIEFACRAP